MKERSKGNMTFFKALIPIIFLGIVLAYSIINYDADPHIPVFATAIVAAIVAMLSGYKWEELEKSIMSMIMSTLQSILILCIIGVLIGMWISGGIVPTMIYYGLKFISPKIFLPTACLICCITSMATGSSWTTAGTVGIALVGMGEAMGVPLPIVAGAVISGAYFGDKVSPLSETTNLAPAVTGVDLFEHIAYMLYTTVPALVISLLLYLFLGFKYSNTAIDSGRLTMILEGLNSQFVISPFLLLPPLFIILMVIKKIPAIPGLIISASLGLFTAIFVQGASAGNLINAAHYGYVSETGMAAIDELLTGGGLDAMMWPISLILVALTLAGIMEASDMIDVLARKILSLVKSVGGLVAATVFVCLGVNIITGEQYLSIVFPGKIFDKKYDDYGLERKLLSRTLSDAGTIISPLIPWGTCGVFMATTLQVDTIDYLPYTFLCLIAPIVAIVYGYTGWTIKKKDVN